MNEKITLDMLTKNSVSVVKQMYIAHNGQELNVGDPHRTAYVNNMTGRESLVADLPAEYSDAVLKVWGAEPTLPSPMEGLEHLA